MWDVVVVGTGIGGSTLGRALAESGRWRILFVEQGSDLSQSANQGGFPEASRLDFRRLPPAERDEILRRSGRMTESVGDVLRGDSFVPYLGIGTGGSSRLFGMAMERMFPSDMDGKWPVSYAEFEGWYEEAERMFGVRGTPDPLRLVETGLRAPASPLSDANKIVFEELRAQALHPYRLHLARETVPGCAQCQGFLCPNPCKNDAQRIALEPALRQPGVELMTDTAVQRLVSSGGGARVTGLDCISKGKQIRLEARVVLLAAGALNSPRILLQSDLADPAGLTGRYLMRHAIDLFVLRGAPPLENAEVSKELAFNDFYEAAGEKLGTVQSFGLAPPVAYLRNQPGWNLWRTLGPLASPVAARFSRIPIIAGIMEDTPDFNNAAGIDGGRLTVRYRLSAADMGRRKVFGERIRRAFRRFQPMRAGGDDRKGLGHVCGTCRFGDDPGASVLDRWNRVHHLDNVYVTDASFFPTSSGVNPALTIAANALRVADHLARVI